jgi:carboxymethylenebutenolidase
MGEMISIHQQLGKIDAYLAVPQTTAKFKGAVIIVHEIWGLTEHIKHVADRVATQGYLVLAPDLYSSTMADRRPSEALQKEVFNSSERVRYNAQPKVRALIAPTKTPQFISMAISRLASCFEYMYNQPLAHQKVIIIGFGMGANYSFGMAIREPRLKGVIAYYGHAQYLPTELRHIHCPILAFYGGKEQSLLKELNGLAPRMHQAGVNFRSVVYAGAGHAFFNDDNPFAYQSGAAEDSWRRIVAFLRDEMV